jgi:hypothetical protein
MDGYKQHRTVRKTRNMERDVWPKIHWNKKINESDYELVWTQQLINIQGLHLYCPKNLSQQSNAFRLIERSRQNNSSFINYQLIGIQRKKPVFISWNVDLMLLAVFWGHVVDSGYWLILVWLPSIRGGMAYLHTVDNVGPQFRHICLYPASKRSYR